MVGILSNQPFPGNEERNGEAARYADKLIRNHANGSFSVAFVVILYSVLITDLLGTRPS